MHSWQNMTARYLMLGASIIALSSAAQAQDNSTQVNNIDDEIIVTGIRQSLKEAADIKRNSKEIVDAITAEDIGKFPDTNLAESLQRITGVSIDRSLGEGSTVTVRGFGADFNLVTLNGRMMPTSTLGDSQSAPSSRSFDFANLASENIAGVNVYKTSRSDIASGGIGATIDIRTTRPLDAPGQIATFGIKGVYDDSEIEDSSFTPELSGLYSNTFNNDRLGVAVSGSYQKRKGGVKEFVGYDSGWHDGRAFTSDFEYEWGALPVSQNNWTYYLQQYGPYGGGDPTEFGPDSSYSPDPGAIYEIPQKSHYGVTSFDRQRINGQLVLQYQFLDNLRGTADYTYSENEVESQRNTGGIWFNYNGNRSAWTSGDVAGPLYFTDMFNVFTGGGLTDLSFEGGKYASKSKNNSLGFNLEWDPNDWLNLELDFHDSSAESKPQGDYGSQAIIGTAVIGITEQSLILGQDLPIISITTDPNIDVFDGANREPTGSVFRNAYMRDDITQLQFKGSAEVDRDIIDTVDFGAGYSENKVRSAFGVLQNNTWGGDQWTPDDFPSDIYTPVSISSLFSGVDGANDSRILSEIQTFDVVALTEALESQYQICSRPEGALNGQAIGNAAVPGTCLAEYSTDRRLKEKTFSVYGQVNNSFDVMGRDANLIFGGRYENTKVDSSALVPTYNGTLWTGDNEFALVPTGDSEFTTVKGDYSVFLPSLYFDMQPFENAKFRAAYSHTISRQQYNKLQGGLELSPAFGYESGYAGQGNPALEPYRSKNFDASLEWYYDDDSYVSAGYYHKNVENFTGDGEFRTTVPALHHPAFGPRGNEARAIYGANATPGQIRNYIRDTYYGGDGAPEGQTADDLVSFRVSYPVVNDDTLAMSGWEFAIQHMFWDSGFGFIANYTLADGDFNYDNAQPYNVPQFVLPGLSDSANIIGFYDKHGFQARLAWNWRDEFLAGAGVNPWYTEAYNQLDGNISYEFNNGITIFGEAINLTGSDRRGHRRHENIVTFYNKQDPRYAVGLRYKF